MDSSSIMSRSDKETVVTMTFQDIDKISPQITTITLSSEVQIAVFLFHNDESTIHSSLPDRGRELFCRGINTFPHWVSERVSTVAVAVRRSAASAEGRSRHHIPRPGTATAAALGSFVAQQRGAREERIRPRKWPHILMCFTADFTLDQAPRRCNTGNGIILENVELAERYLPTPLVKYPHKQLKTSVSSFKRERENIKLQPDPPLLHYWL